jgi:hypothetical protein
MRNRIRSAVLGRLVLAGVLAWSLGLAACADNPVASTTEVVDLAGVDQLADMFNEVEPDTPKLLLLLSPT